MLDRRCCIAGVINSNPSNNRNWELGFEMYPSEACLQKGGHLREGVLKVKLAVLAVGGVIREDGFAQRGSIREAAMHLAESIRAGATISLGPVMPNEAVQESSSSKPDEADEASNSSEASVPWLQSEPGCLVHHPKK